MLEMQGAFSGETKKYRPMTFLLTLISLLTFIPAPQPLATAGEGTASSFHERDLAVMRLASPQQFALLLHEPETAPRLYKVGDLLVHPDEASRLLEVERIQGNRLVLRDRRTGRRWSLKPRRATPLARGLVFLGTVSLTEVRYRFEASDQIMAGAPVMVALTGSRAVVRQEVPAMRAEGQPVRPRVFSPSALGRRGDRATASAGSPSRIGDSVYEVDKRALAPTLEKLTRKLARGLRDMTQALLSHGPMLPVQTSAGDGVLTKAGFTVTQPKIARTFGIEVGDTIVALNGRPVSSPLNAYWVFQEVFIRDQTKKLRVDLVRAGRPVTQTYTIK